MMSDSVQKVTLKMEPVNGAFGFPSSRKKIMTSLPREQYKSDLEVGHYVMFIYPQESKVSLTAVAIFTDLLHSFSVKRKDPINEKNGSSLNGTTQKCTRKLKTWASRMQGIKCKEISIVKRGIMPISCKLTDKFGRRKRKNYGNEKTLAFRDNLNHLASTKLNSITACHK